MTTIKKTTHKPFLMAYNVLQVLEEKGAHGPGILMAKDGRAWLYISQGDYKNEELKGLAEALLVADKWFLDATGSYCLHSDEGLITEEAIEE